MPNLQCALHEALTLSPLNTFRMDWNTDCTLGLLQHQHLTSLMLWQLNEHKSLQPHSNETHLIILSYTFFICHTLYNKRKKKRKKNQPHHHNAIISALCCSNPNGKYIESSVKGHTGKTGFIIKPKRTPDALKIIM